MSRIGGPSAPPASKMPRPKILALSFIGSLVCQTAAAQELTARVTVILDALPIEHRHELATLQQDLEHYLNTQRFGDTPWEGERIPVELTIIVTGRSGSWYSARLIFQSARPLSGGALTPLLRIYEPDWSFQYTRGASLTYQPLRYDPLLTLIDFYALLAIGLDCDTYEELGGTPYFRKAHQLAQLAAASNAKGFSTFAEPGQFSRFSLATELISPQFEPFRRFIFAYYVDGLEQLQHDRSRVLTTIDSLLTELLRFKERLGTPSIVLQLFFEAKYQELIELFRNWDSPTLLPRLRALDPRHGTDYERALGR